MNQTFTSQAIAPAYIQDPKITPTCCFLLEHLDLPEATGLPDAKWEPFQISHLNNQSILAITNKSRQVGWSWITAAEAVARCSIFRRSLCLFISINQDEASEKVRYSKQILEALDKDVRQRLIIDNKLELEFQNGSRLISLPCRPARGKARAWIYLDEFAHYQKDREIYQAVVPVISKGGHIRIGSSPLGAGGLFWEIYTESVQPYPGYKRDFIPWWIIRGLCKDVERAQIQAPELDTFARVKKFGTRRLRTIFENVFLDDFKQEYECEWVDESIAWLDWELIKRNQGLAQADQLIYFRAKTIDAAFELADELKAAIDRGEVEPVLVGGMDVGRKKDLTEIILLGKGTSGQLPYRAGISLAMTEFDDQRAVVNKCLELLPISQFLIDTNGIGMQLAEDCQLRWGPKVFPATFTNATKELWAVEVKLRFQRTEAPIPTDRDLVYQLHSIKKKFTAAKNAVFDCEKSEKHHADMFWAYALATWAGHELTAANEWIEAMKKRGSK